jgi:quinol monooxygenase YgiN
MVRAILTMTVRDGCQQTFEQTWRAAVMETGNPPGAFGQALMYDPAQRMYTITSDWENRDALRSFETSPERKALSEALEPLRESATKTVLDIVARI